MSHTDKTLQTVDGDTMLMRLKMMGSLNELVEIIYTPK